MKLKFIFLLIASLNLITLTGWTQNSTVQSIVEKVELDSLTFFVKQLSGEEKVFINGVQDAIYSRHRDQDGNEKAFQFIKQKLFSYGHEIDSQQFSTNGKNLFGIKTGTVFSDRKLIIGAHYDNRPAINIAPGADDNASGTAAVIEAARIFSRYDFPFTIVFAFWDEEEQGLIGSKAYTSLAAANGDSIIGYINLDMLGWDGNGDFVADLHTRPIAGSVQLAEKTSEVNSRYSVGLNLNFVNPGIGATDHAAFWSNGFTAIGINEEYSNDFNPFYHSPADSLGQFNLQFYEKCTKLAIATLAECALDRNLVLSAKEQPFAKEMFKVYPNPVGHYLTIKKVTQGLNEYEVKVYNEMGQFIQMSSSNENININVSSYPTGTYILRISSIKGHPLETKTWIKL